MTVTASQTTGRRDATVLQSWRKERNVSVAALRSRRVTRTVREWRCSLVLRPDGGPWQHQKGRIPGMSTSATPPRRPQGLLVDRPAPPPQGPPPAVEPRPPVAVGGGGGAPPRD